MTLRALSLTLPLALAACLQDESLSGYAQTGVTYRLAELDGAPFNAPATLILQSGGRVSGTGPCNGWSAAQTAPYPWFDLGPIAATRRACPDLAAEAAFFAALERMTIAEVLADTLVLSNTDGGEMVFHVE